MNSDKKKIVVIIGAGPAGLTAAYELLKYPGFLPVILEKSQDVGGLSKTVNFNGNRIDIGGHRFFSKSEVVMKWWSNILPVQKIEESQTVSYHGKSTEVSSGEGPDPDSEDKVMLVRSRLSRIFYNKKFFTYPISLSKDTIRNLGLVRLGVAGLSYIKAVIFPITPEKNLEDFYINRFGRHLYNTFFRDYTEKVWGVPCNKIPADWGAQRVKGLSVAQAIIHSIKKVFQKKNDIYQKGTETSLIERFLYPKYGPGQMWEEVADKVKEKGGEIVFGCNVDSFAFSEESRVCKVIGSMQDGTKQDFDCDFVISSMPVVELIKSMGSSVPKEVGDVASGLKYRDFITVGVLLNKMSTSVSASGMTPDNWVYIQEPYVKVGRIQVFNNWSPYMVKDKNGVWIGMEYFSNEDDEIWRLSELEMKALALKELESLGFASKEEVLDSVVIKMEKAYPAYFGTYDQFDVIRKFTDSIPNLFLVGRNGMHRYNNQDHSMLTAMEAINQIVEHKVEKGRIWDINTEQDYHESKK